MSKPFGEDEDDEPVLEKNKVGLKNVSSQKSIFDSMDKKPSKEELDSKIRNMANKAGGYQAEAASLIKEFNKILEDKTLMKNKNVFQKELETDLIGRMVKLASKINKDPDEEVAIGTLIFLVPLIRTCFKQHNRINDLEYSLSKLENIVNSDFLKNLVTKEIQQALDKKKDNE